MANQGRLPRVLVTTAAFMFVIAGLQYAAVILLPLVFSIFLATMASPLVVLLRRMKVPGPLAILMVVGVCFGVLAGATTLVISTLKSFAVALPQYEAPMQALVADGIEQLRLMGWAPDDIDVAEYFNPRSVMGMVGQTVNLVIGSLARVIIVTVTMSFILLEAAEIGAKLQVAFGKKATDTAVATAIGHAGEQIQRYLFIKTLVSFVTGALAFGWTMALGLDFPLLWGLLAFLLNYIPSVGSILAAVPPFLLALLAIGPSGALAVAVGYAVINVLLGNVIEPRLLGRSLGLSPLVVFLSLLFWGWVWGPAGMLFSVPMTVITKILLYNYEDTRWLAVLLGRARDVERYEAMQQGQADPDPSIP
jgi:AI-2 transport protein TqsA